MAEMELGSCSSGSTPTLGPFICCRCGHKKEGKKNPNDYTLKSEFCFDYEDVRLFALPGKCWNQVAAFASFSVFSCGPAVSLLIFLLCLVQQTLACQPLI